MAHTPHWLLALSLPGFVLAGPHPELGTKFSAPAGTGREMIGTRPPEWTFTNWHNSPPLSLEALKGKVVLVRWWTAPGCPYCAASADALNAFSAKYAARGLVVIGAYHHKSSTPLTTKHVVAQAKRLGFSFPVAVDDEWKTLRKWWLYKVDGGWTSVTFLIDRGGVIRHIHGGGAFFEGEPGYAELEDAILKALDAQAPK